MIFFLILFNRVLSLPTPFYNWTRESFSCNCTLNRLVTSSWFYRRYKQFYLSISRQINKTSIDMYSGRHEAFRRIIFSTNQEYHWSHVTSAYEGTKPHKFLLPPPINWIFAYSRRSSQENTKKEHFIHFLASYLSQFTIKFLDFLCNTVLAFFFSQAPVAWLCGYRKKFLLTMRIY